MGRKAKKLTDKAKRAKKVKKARKADFSHKQVEINLSEKGK